MEKKTKNVHIKWERKKTFSFLLFLVVLIVHKHNTDCRYYFVYRQKLHWNSSFTFLLVWFYCGCIEKLFPCFLLFLCSDIHLSLYPRFKFVCGVNLSPFQKKLAISWNWNLLFVAFFSLLLFEWLRFNILGGVECFLLTGRNKTFKKWYDMTENRKSIYQNVDGRNFFAKSFFVYDFFGDLTFLKWKLMDFVWRWKCCGIANKFLKF